MRYSAADIMRAYLLSLEDSLVAAMPGVGILWPIFVSMIPDDQDNCIAIYNVRGTYDAHIARTNTVVYHPGVQIVVRSRVQDDAISKMNQICTILDGILRQVVVMDNGDTFGIQAVHRQGDPIEVPGEEPRGRRIKYIINARMSIASGVPPGQPAGPGMTGSTMYGDLDMNGNYIHALADPVSPLDAVNRKYVDSAIAAFTGGGTVDKNFVFQQMTASSLWVVFHNLQKYPAVSVFDTTGQEIIGDVVYVSVNQVTLAFSAPFSGTATFN